MPFPDNKPHALVIGNGESLSKNRLIHLSQKAAYVICTDGGALTAKISGIIPNAIIGDLDSINEESLEYFKNQNSEIIRDPSQSENDLEKCIITITRRGYSNIVLAGFMGKRDDQSMATLLLMKKYTPKAEILTLTNYSEIHLLNKGQYHFNVQSYQTISLFGFPRAFGITTDGLKFSLNDQPLYEGSKGLSNLSVSDSFRISLKSGTIIVIINLDVT